jgi:hypothetical protein
LVLPSTPSYSLAFSAAHKRQELACLAVYAVVSRQLNFPCWSEVAEHPQPTNPKTPRFSRFKECLTDAYTSSGSNDWSSSSKADAAEDNETRGIGGVDMQRSWFKRGKVWCWLRRRNAVSSPRESFLITDPVFEAAIPIWYSSFWSAIACVSVTGWDWMLFSQGIEFVSPWLKHSSCTVFAGC